MVKKNIDLIKDEFVLIKELWDGSYKECQWRAGFAVGLIALFKFVFTALGTSSPCAKFLTSLAFFSLVASVVLCLLTLGKIRRDVEYTEFENENELGEEPDEQLELEVFKRKYRTRSNFIVGIREFNKWSPYSLLSLFLGVGFFLAAIIWTIWDPA